MNKITSISFDADGTLWDFTRVMRHSLDCVLTELRRLAPAHINPLTIETMIAIRNQVAEELKGKVTNLEEIRLAAFKRTLQQIGIFDDALATHLNDLYLQHRFEDIDLYDDVLPVLNALQDNYTLGLLSNGNSYPEKCGLKNRFQFVVFSQDHSIEKPDPKIFKIAMSQAECSPREFLHVGDSLQSDVVGANKAGIRSVWLNRTERENDSGIQADFEIKSLTELMGICRQEEISDAENL